MEMWIVKRELWPLKAFEQYFAVVLLIMLHKAFPTFGLWMTYRVVWPFRWKLLRVRPCNAVYFVAQEASNFWVCRWNPNECQWPFKWKLLSSTFLWYCLLCCKNRFQLCGLGMKSSCLTLQIKATEHYFSAMLVILLHKMLPWNPKVWPFKWKLLSSPFLWYCLLCCTRWY